jgi:hypothetical protein
MNRTLMIALALLMVSPFLMGGSCNQHVVRDRTVFQAETDIAEQMALQPAATLKAFLLEHCTCDAGNWVGVECAKAAKLVLTVETRAPYHRAMAQYNAGITDERPPKTPPVIPAPGTLCPAPPPTPATPAPGQ